MTGPRPAPGGLVAFLGPSISLECAAAAAPGVRFLPPIRQGDLTTVVEFDKPRAVLVVDGEFGQSLSVWHKEIVAAVNRGVRVLGASSMGALRAAELDRWGMEGVGEIYAYYRDNFLTADEDVALVHGDAEAGWRPLTWPLVNVRATVDALCSAGRIDTSDGDAVLAAAQSLHFRDRVAPALRQRLIERGVDRRRAEALTGLVAEHYVDQKRADALLALDRLLRIEHVERPDFERVTLLGGRHPGIDFSDVVLTRPSGRLRRYQLVNDAALHLADFTELNNRATDRYAALELARDGGVTATDEQVAEERARFLRRRGLTEDSLGEWLVVNDLDEGRFGDLMYDEALLRRVRRQIRDLRFFETNRRMVIEQLQLEGRYAEVADAAARRRTLADAQPSPAFPSTDEEFLHALKRHMAATGWRSDTDLLNLADEHGFDGPAGLVLTVLDANAALVENDRRRRRLTSLFGSDASTPAAGDQAASGRRLHALLESHQASEVLLAAVELGIPAALADAPHTTDAVAAATGTRPERLVRLLRVLAGLGVLRLVDERWELTGEGRHLADPEGLAAYAAHLRDGSGAVWQRLAGTMRGHDLPDLPTSASGDAAIHAAAEALGLTEAVLRDLELRPGDRVVDLGGGLGGLAEAIATHRSDVEVVLAELPDTAARAAERLARRPVGGRVAIEAWAPGATDRPEPDADVVVIQRVLMNLDDEAAVDVLSSAARRLRAGGRLHVVDVVADGSVVAGFVDLYNLLRSGGAARDDAGWHALAAAAGLTVEIGPKPVPPYTRLTFRPAAPPAPGPEASS